MNAHRAAWKDIRQSIEAKGRYRSVVGRRSRYAISLKKNLVGMCNFGSHPIKLPRLHGVLMSRSRNIRLARHRLVFPQLPRPFDGYRIIHVSDPHFDALPGLEDAIYEKLQGQAADAMVITGDFLDSFNAPPERLVQPLKRVLSAIRPKDGFFAVLGNHDSWRCLEVLESLGVRVLVNETLVIRRGAAKLAFTGTDDPSYFFTKGAVKALEESPPCFKVALVHSPELADVASQSGYSLYLAGHTHGGQICWTTGKPIYVDLQRFKDFHQGIWSHGAMTGFTNIGVGVSVLPYRFFKSGEIASLTLCGGKIK